MAPLLAGSAPPAVRRHRRLDLALGILVGIVLGICVVAVFVFIGSEGTIDAPRISGVDTGKPATEAQAAKGAAAKPAAGAPAQGRPVPVVRVVGGAPPASGPIRLSYKRGDRVRFEVLTDAPVAIAIPSYGIEKTLEDGQILSFKATHVGQFPVVAAASEIGLASLVVSR